MAGLLRESWLNWLLLLLPASWALDLLGLPAIWLFATSALAIIPLAGLIGETTEELAHWVGQGLGGILNATLGNATELIIVFFALRAGLQEVVKASITGSIIGNILLVLGLAMLVGGWGRERQTFSCTHAGANSAMLFLAVVALVMPAVLDLVVFGRLEPRTPIVELLSLLVAVVLIATYLGSLVFSLRTHRQLLSSVPEEAHRPRLNLAESLLLLAVATAAVAVESELLVSTIAEATRVLGMTEFFVGVVVVAIVGNAAEHSAAVLMAMRNRMELAVTIATGSSTQVALFVAPVLVFASFIIGQPMSLIFNGLEIVGIGLSVVALAFVVYDGESNWFEGMQLIAVYLVLALVFYFVPAN
ncbi:MAG: calcium/proton exchanger [Chloroflexota bacterium]